MSEILTVKAQKKLLLAALKVVKKRVEKGEEPMKYGICFNVEEVIAGVLRRKGYDEYDVAGEADEIASEVLPEYFPKWPQYSGSSAYPVPCPDGGLARGAFTSKCNEFSRTSFWDGEYGKLRRDLLDFCINELKKELQ